MKSFLFITTLTPTKLLTPLRRGLFELYIESLKSQTYDNWKAILVGEENKVDGNIIYIKSEAVIKSDKLIVAYDYINSMNTKPDYLIRIDDDDLISPFILEHAAKLEFDCYADLYHTFYDITTGKMGQQKRPWLANTVIHKFSDSISIFGENNLPLFMLDHSQYWHVFYQDKKVVYTQKEAPMYLRIISPTTITSKMDPTQIQSSLGFNKEKYASYLKGFGKWSKFDIPDFEPYFNSLVNIWERFSNQKIKFKKSFFSFLRK